MNRPSTNLGLAFLLILISQNNLPGESLERIKYNHPGLVVDLAVGLWAWPLPIDFDQDGDLDLVVSCPDKPYSGLWYFENPGGQTNMPVFRPAVRIADVLKNVQVSYVGDEPRVLTPGFEFQNVVQTKFRQRTRLPLQTKDVHRGGGRIRANQWKYSDYNGDGALDLVVGIGDWTDYGWDNAYDQSGRWQNGPLRGFVYVALNEATSEQPSYAAPFQVQADGQPIDVYGMPSPNFADFDNDGDLDILCGEFVDGFTYFENVGTRSAPSYAAGRRLPIRMDLCMIVPVAVDWDRDGDVDLIVGEEDGRVALVEHTGRIEDGIPQFLPARHFQQQAEEVNFGALVTPVSVDWDNDGDEDLICGNTAGYIGLIENLDGGNPPRWAAPKYLTAEGEVIRIMAGPNGSIQGPCETKWGYTTLSVADWDHDGLSDIIVNSIWGKVHWYRNVGRLSSPRLAAAEPLTVQWPAEPPKPVWQWWDPEPGELATQWRTTPVVIDLNEDGLNDLVMLDHEGYLAFFRRYRDHGQLRLAPPARSIHGENGSVFDRRQAPLSKQDGPLRLNADSAGKSGRRKLCVVDWDNDGRLDLLVNSVAVNLMRNVSTDDRQVVLRDMGQLGTTALAGHTTSPTTVDWDGNGVRDLLVGAEDGFLYYMSNQHVEQRSAP